MKNLKDFKKFAISNKDKSTISGGLIPLPGEGGEGGNNNGGSYTPPMYCCGGDPSSICGAQIHYVKVYCRTSNLPDPVRIN